MMKKKINNDYPKLEYSRNRILNDDASNLEISNAFKIEDKMLASFLGAG
ncbi:hypothetical protein ACFL6W_07325 [Thermodesulfobacteriota bacterium]